MSAYFVSCVAPIENVGEDTSNVVVVGRPKAKVVKRVVVPDDAVVSGAVPIRWGEPVEWAGEVAVVIGARSRRALLYVDVDRHVVFVSSRRYALYYMLVGLKGLAEVLRVPENVGEWLRGALHPSVRNVVVSVAYFGRVEAVPSFCSEEDFGCFRFVGWSSERLRRAVFRVDGEYYRWDSERRALVSVEFVSLPDEFIRTLVRRGASLPRVKTRWKL